MYQAHLQFFEIFSILSSVAESESGVGVAGFYEESESKKKFYGVRSRSKSQKIYARLPTLEVFP